MGRSANQQHRNPSTGAGAPAEQRKSRVLLVEDMPDVAEGMQMLLQLWGHEVKVLGDGNQAVQEAENFRPDAILLDIGLPGMSGYEVAQQLRQQPGFDQVTFIALTGYGQQADREKAFASGFDYHLVKGASLDSLKALLAP